MKKCPFCGAELNDDSLFCTKCGNQLPKDNQCPHCGASVNDGDAFCTKCGKPLAQSSDDSDVHGKDEYDENIFKKYLPHILGCIVIVCVIFVWNRNEGNFFSSEGQATNEVTDTIPYSNNPDLSSFDSAIQETNEEEDTYNNSYNTPATETTTYEMSSREFYNEQSVIGYLANQRFHNSSGVDINIDGSGRIYIDGDAAGVLSVMRYSSKSAVLRYSNGLYGEGKIIVRIVGDKFELEDPVDGSVWYQ